VRRLPALLLALTLASCGGGPALTASSPRPPERTSLPPPGRGCRSTAGTALPTPGAPAAAQVLQPAGEGPLVEAVVYPHPAYEGNPWSQWGQGLVLSDGRYLSAIGDHLGADGNSYLYAYDPSSSELTMLGDVASIAGEPPGSYGHGKIHAQLVSGRCDEVYVATYWGDQPKPEEQDAYGGDLLFRLDPARGTVSNLGVPVPDHGIPSLAGWPERGLLYGEAVDSAIEDEKTGSFFVYDTAREEVVLSTAEPEHTGFRSIAVDAEGRAYYSLGGGALGVYDPETGEVSRHPATLPGDWLRASTGPGPDSTVYGVTVEPDALFALEPGGEIRPLGAARGYTTSLALDPSGDRLYYVPGAHGDSWEQGTPVVAVDTRTGEQTVVVELAPLMEDGLGLLAGGSYNVAVDPAGGLLYVGLNAGVNGEPFGEVVLAVVHLR